MPVRGRVSRAGVELVYWTWPGGAPPLLALHGIGNYGRYWDLFAKALAERAVLVAPDARGHGASARPQAAYAPAEFVADALAVLDAADIDGAVVVGHSMGGGHAIDLAATHPERVRALVIVDASPAPMPDGSERARRLLTTRPERFSSPAEARAYIERTSPGYGDAVYRNRVRWAFRKDADGGLVWRSDANALKEIMRFAGDPSARWSALERIRVPALVVRGTRSNVLSADDARRMRDALSAGALLELDAGHNVALERPRELADAVVALARAS